MTKFTRALEKCEALCYNSYRKKHFSKIEFLNKKEYLQLWMYTYKKTSSIKHHYLFSRQMSSGEAP